MKILVCIIFAISPIALFAQDFYAVDHLTEIKLYFDDSNWDDIMDDYYANDLDELLYGTAIINGQSFDSVGVAYKGNSTYNPNNSKNPLKIKLADVYDWQHIQGYQTIKLSNGRNDPSFVREVLSYEIGRKYMDMPLSNYAKVYINDDFYGLFSSSESINKDFMQDHFYINRDNVRFKCNPASVFGGNGSSLQFLGTDSSLYFDYYELKSDFGWNTLVDFTYNLTNNSSAIESKLDVDRAIWMLAFNNVLASMDSYSGPFRQNYYLIEDDHGRMLTVIWDLNESIGGFEMVNSGGGPPGGVTDLTELNLFLRENDTQFPLIYQLFQNERYRKMYVAHVKTIVAENLTNNDYSVRAQELQSFIESAVQADPNAIYSHNQFITNLNSPVGSGPGTTYGVNQVLSGREAYLTSLSAFNEVAPSISNVSTSSNAPSAFSTITITAEISDANYAYLGYRFYKADPFQKVQMYDDGLHNDGLAADGVYGANITIGAADLQYYIYAENGDVGKFSPVRAEHEFYELTLSSGIVINEIQSSNSFIAMDQYGEYDDWIELYNNSSSAIDLTGYYLSDTLSNADLWQIPAGTSIGSGEYLIIWCDNDISQAGLHANFKLSAAGETVYLFDAAMNLISEVTYPQVMENHSYGRYVNGSGGFIPMVATHNAENSFTSLTLEEENGMKEIMIYPNPTTDFVTLELPSSEELSVQIYDLTGRVVFENQFSGPLVKLDLSAFESGTYLVHVEGDHQLKRLVKQ